MKKALHFSTLLIIYLIILIIVVVGSITYLSNSFFKDYMNAVLNHKPTIQEQIQEQLGTKLRLPIASSDIKITKQDENYAVGEAILSTSENTNYIWVGKKEASNIALVAYSTDYLNCIDIGDHDIPYELLPTCFEPYLKTHIDRNQRILNKKLAVETLNNIKHKDISVTASDIKEIYMYWTLQNDGLFDQKRYIAYQIEYVIENESTHLNILTSINNSLNDAGFSADLINTASGNLSQYNGFIKDNTVCVIIASKTNTEIQNFNIKLSCGILD